MIPAGCPLTESQLAVLKLVTVEGLTIDQAAALRVVTGSTIRTELKGCYRRLGVMNQTQAAIECLREGWITIPGLGSVDALMLNRIECLLGDLVAAIEVRKEREPLTEAQRGYLEAFLSWRRSSFEGDDGGTCRDMALERLRFVLAEANVRYP